MYLLTVRNVLREYICWVDLPLDILNRYRSSPNLFLEPQRVRLQVPQLPKAGSGSDTQRCAGVGPHPDWDADREVLHDALMSQPGPCCLDKSIKFSFAGRQRN